MIRIYVVQARTRQRHFVFTHYKGGTHPTFSIGFTNPIPAWWARIFTIQYRGS